MHHLQVRMFKRFAYGVGLATLVCLFCQTPIFEQIEHRFGLPVLYWLRGPTPAPAGAIIVAIDPKSISWLKEIVGHPSDEAAALISCLPANAIGDLHKLRGPSTIPRPLYSCLLKQLQRFGFPVVVFDILFSVPTVKEDDALFAKTLRSHNGSIILTGFEQIAIEEGGSEFRVQRVVQPIRLFKQSAASSGAFVIPRSAGPVYGYWKYIPGFEEIKSLPKEALRVFSGSQTNIPAENSPNSAFQYFWFYGPPSSIRTISMRDLLAANVAPEVLSAAPKTTVFVGASDPTRAYYVDSYPSMYTRITKNDVSGVELAATAYLNALQGQNLRRLPWVTELMVLGCYALAFGVQIRARNRSTIIGIFAAAAVYFLVATILFIQQRIFVPVITPAFIVVPLVLILAVLVRSNIAFDLIMRLAPESVARQMLDNSQTDRGEVASVDATVVFFDLIESTTIGQDISELEFAGIINAYNDAVAKTVENYGGCVIAYTGDGASALFESNIVGPDHALLACKAAIAIVQDVRKIKTQEGGTKVGPLRQRIGINTGRIAAGAFGAKRRFNFSVVGDVVNVASRLERLGKTLYPDQTDVILVGAATHERVKDPVLHFAHSGRHHLPGRTMEEDIFRLTID